MSRGGHSFKGGHGRGRGRCPPHFQLCWTNDQYTSACPHLSSYISHKRGSDAYLEKAIHAQCHVMFNDPNWFVESSATDHMDSYVASVSQRKPYTWNSKVSFGGGNVLPISHIGRSMIHNNIKLRDVLVVPTITKNLFSISKLTTDNSMDVLFSQPQFISRIEKRNRF